MHCTESVARNRNKTPKKMSSHELAAMRVAQNRERHEARVEALQTRDADKALDCVGDGSFRIAKQTISLVREITPLVTPDLRAKVHYTGWLAPVPSDSAAPLINDALIKQATSARPFDSSRGRQPFSFVVGHRQVIGGWDAAVAAMKVGDCVEVNQCVRCTATPSSTRRVDGVETTR